MQTDYKNNNTAINDNEHILILMVWSSSCITRRTTCTNVDLIQCKSYDKMQQSKSMVDAQVIILFNATINHPFCRSCRYVRCAVVQAYHLHRIENTTIQFPINNVYEHGFDSMHKLSRWYATIKIDAQALIRYNNQPSILPRCHHNRIKFTTNQLPLLGVVSRLLFWFGRTWIR